MRDVDRITLLSVHAARESEPARSRLACRLSRHEEAVRRVRAARRLRMVDGEPRRQGRTGKRAGVLRLGRLLSGAGRATGDRAAASSPDEETKGRHRRVVLGHGLWQRRFASDPAIVGRSIEVDGRAARGRRHRAARLRLSDGRADLGAARVQCRGTPSTAGALPHRDRASGARAHARGRKGADGDDRRTARRASIRTRTADARCGSIRSATA